MQGGVGIPQVKFYGTEGEFNVMVMDVTSFTVRGLSKLSRMCTRKVATWLTEPTWVTWNKQGEGHTHAPHHGLPRHTGAEEHSA